MLEKMQQWLQTFPKWEGSLTFDYAQDVPGSTGLYPQGITELSRREDVLGNCATRYSCTFELRRAALPGRENAQWLLELQSWVADQDRKGLAPKFGDTPQSERIRAYEGRLQTHKQLGSALYTVYLSAEFTKIYEVN